MIRVVAVDGPAASGKSSTAREVARRLGFRHVDSGDLYRRVTAVALGLPPGAAADAIVAAADRLELDVPAGSGTEPSASGAPDLARRARSSEVTAMVSAVAALPTVRAWVGRKLRAVGELGSGVVMDGRDIGTVVFPDAPVKIFLVARPEVRARRRLLERAGGGGAVEPPDPVAVRRETELIEARDRTDAGRPIAPLEPAPDAIRVDTSELDFEEQVQVILDLVARSPLQARPVRR